MANDLTEAFTVGGLATAHRGNGARILCMTGAVTLSSVDDGETGSGLVNADGTVSLKAQSTSSGADYVATDFALSYGAGIVAVTGMDANDETGDKVRLAFTFGDTVDDVSQFSIIAASGSFSGDANGVAATMAPLGSQPEGDGVTLLGTGTDMLLCGGVSKIKGNTVEFVVDRITSDFDGNDVDLAANNTIAFSIMAFALPSNS